MLRPHHREDTEFGESRRTAENALYVVKFVRAEAMRARLSEINLRLARQRSWRHAHLALSTIERKILSPSSPPSIGSTACSGCGIRPNTLKRSLHTPAIACIEPLGFAPSSSPPEAST